MTARMPESDAQDFLARVEQCIVAAFERGDRGTAQVLQDGMREFERLRRVEPVDHPFRPDAGADCSECGRGSDEHLTLGLTLSVVQGGKR